MASHAEHSVRELEERVSRNPASLAFSRLADSYRKHGEIQKAIAMCTEALLRHPDYTTGHLILGRCYLEQEKFDEAIGEFTTTCRLDRHNQVAIKMLADIFSKRGMEAQAGDLYSLLLRMDPDNPSLAHLCSVFQGSGMQDLFTIIGLDLAADRAGFSDGHAAEAQDLAGGAPTTLSVTESVDEFGDGLGGEQLVTGDDVSDRMDAIFEGQGEDPIADAPTTVTPRPDVFEALESEPLAEEPAAAAAQEAFAEADLVSGSDVADRLDEMLGGALSPEPSGQESPQPELADSIEPAIADESPAAEVLSPAPVFDMPEASPPQEPQELPASVFDTPVPLKDLASGDTMVIDKGDIAASLGFEPQADDEVAGVSGADVSARLDEIFNDHETTEVGGEELGLASDTMVLDRAQLLPESEADPLASSGSEPEPNEESLSDETMVLDRTALFSAMEPERDTADATLDGGDVATRLDDMFGGIAAQEEAGGELPSGETMVFDPSELALETGDELTVGSAQPEPQRESASDDRLADLFDADESSSTRSAPLDSEATMAFEADSPASQDHPDDDGQILAGSDVSARLADMFGGDTALDTGERGAELAAEPQSKELPDQLGEIFSGFDAAEEALEAVQPAPSLDSSAADPLAAPKLLDRDSAGQDQLPAEGETGKTAELDAAQYAVGGEIMELAQASVDSEDLEASWTIPGAPSQILDTSEMTLSIQNFDDELLAPMPSAPATDELSEPTVASASPESGDTDEPAVMAAPMPAQPSAANHVEDEGVVTGDDVTGRLDEIFSDRETKEVPAEAVAESPPPEPDAPAPELSDEIVSDVPLVSDETEIIHAANVAEEESIETVTGEDVAARLEQMFAETQLSEQAIPDDDEPAAPQAAGSFYTVSGENATAQNDEKDMLQRFELESGDGTQSGEDDLLATVDVDQTAFEHDSPAEPLAPPALFEEEADDGEGEDEGGVSYATADDGEQVRPASIPDHVLTPTLADIYFQQGQPQLAIQIYQRLLKMDPDNERILARIARIEQALGGQPGVTAANASAGSATTLPPSAETDEETRVMDAPLQKEQSKEGRPLKGVRIKKKVRERIKKTRKKSS